jgi:hypothetical protein
MKKLFVMFCVAFSVLFAFGIANAVNVNLYVDAAPNAYGSPYFAGWQLNAYDSAVHGNFVNMGNSYNPANSGTTNFEINDAVVYSFGDLGKRLHFVYWMPNETISSLTTNNFQISVKYLWDGVEYVDTDWYTPKSWQEKDGGVIGTYGFAWWGAYGINTQEALDADLANWDLYQGNVTLYARFDGGSAELTAYHNPVPIPGALWLFGPGLVGLAALRRRFM